MADQGLMSGPDAAPPDGTPRSTWEKIIHVNDRLWSLPTGLIEQIGTHVTLFISSLRWLFKRPFRVGVLIEAMDYIGVQSLLIVCMIGLFVGMVFALQLTSALRQFGTEGFVGATLGIAVTRELSPVFTSIVVAARAGAGMATELGSMRITEQIDALAALGVNPVRHLAVPRLLACVLLIPVLTVLANFMGVMGGALISVGVYHIESHYYWQNTRGVVGMWDLTTGLLKPVFFGAAIAVISCHRGFHSDPGAEGVGRAATRAFVLSFIAILVLDFFLGLFLNNLYDYLWPSAGPRML
jgi:phospholipid/cholesterol/gamma-HCH transport system permease protein